MLSPEQYLTFVLLRKTKKIGRIWSVDGGFLLAPLDSLEGMDDFKRAEFISLERFIDLLDTLSGVIVVERKPVKSEVWDLGRMLRRK